MKPEVVRFSGRPHPFRVAISRCANPECECTETAFHLQEVIEPGESAAEPIVFHVRVDARTWEEITPPARAAEIARLAQEFLRDYPAGEKAGLKKAMLEKQRIARRLQEYRIDPGTIEEGTLLSFSHIVSKDGISKSQYSCADVFEHQRVRYVVDDLYCPNPDCPCRELHLRFLRYSPASGTAKKVVAEDFFLAVLSLDGQAKIVECFGCSRVDAEPVLWAWQEDNADDLEKFEGRYEAIKNIARRSMTKRVASEQRYDLVPERPAPTALRAGRNDRCPCGSGKKFKRCCGRKSSLI
jgi:hypothetical protein